LFLKERNFSRILNICAVRSTRISSPVGFVKKTGKLGKGEIIMQTAIQVPESAGEPGHHTAAVLFETPVLGIGLRVRFFQRFAGRCRVTS
jgi:hypothetical protein